MNEEEPTRLALVPQLQIPRRIIPHDNRNPEIVAPKNLLPLRIRTRVRIMGDSAEGGIDCLAGVGWFGQEYQGSLGLGPNLGMLCITRDCSDEWTDGFATSRAGYLVLPRSAGR